LSRTTTSATSGSAPLLLVIFGQIGWHSRLRRNRSEGEAAPMTLGQALAAKVRLIVWCKACGHPRSGTRSNCALTLDHRHRVYPAGNTAQRPGCMM
jgi:hypothetical protein